MKTDRVERIAFRFTKAEIQSLLKLMGEKELPGASLSAQEADDLSVNSLVDGGVVMPCGEMTLVDRTITLILRSAARAKSRIELNSAAGTAVLYAGEKMCVLIAQDQTAVVRVEPIENVRAAHKPLNEAAARLGDGTAASLVRGQETLAGDIAQLLEQLDRQ